LESKGFPPFKIRDADVIEESLKDMAIVGGYVNIPVHS